MRRLIVWPLAVVVCIVVCILAWFVSGGVWLYGDITRYTEQRRGRLVETTLERTVPSGDTHLTHYYQLRSSSGLEVRLALRRPLRVLDRPLPLVVLLDGFKHGRDAIDRMGESGNTILAVVSYPYDGDRHLKALTWMVVSRRIRRTMHDTPAALMLVLDFLLQQPGVDPSRVPAPIPRTRSPVPGGSTLITSAP